MGSILRAHSAFGLSQFHDELWQHLEHAAATHPTGNGNFVQKRGDK